MKKIIYTRGRIFTVLIIFIYAQSVNAKPSLLWRMEFDSNIIKTSELLDIDISGDKQKKFPLRSVMTERYIYTLDKRGRVDKKIPLEGYAKATISADGMTMATLRGKEITITDIDNNEKGIVTIADPQPVVLPQHITFELSPNGKYVIIISWFSKTIYFHDRYGKMLTKHNFEDLRESEIKFSRDSHYVVIHVPNWGEGKTNGYLVFFNQKSEKFWQFEHKGAQAKFDISSDGNSVALATEDRLYSLDKECTVIYETELIPGGINIALSENGEYLAVTRTTDHNITLLDNKNGNKLWDYRIEGFDSFNSPFTFLDISAEGTYVAFAISKDWTRRNKEGVLYLLNKSENIEWHESLKGSSFEGGLSPDGKCVLMMGDREVCIYR